LVLTANGFDEKTPIEVNNPFGGKPAFFQTDGGRTALIGIKSSTPAGRYNLTATAGDVKRKFSIEVTTRKFDEQFLTVEQAIVDKTIGNSEANDQYNSEVQPLKFFADPKPAWLGSFVLPIDGTYRITTTFGMRRTTNGVPGDRHGGIDYACPTGTPVLASNAGVVKLAKNIMLTGNTVLIEHGMGLKSWYYHMDSIAVKQGETVTKGQVIGAVGTTGFSTGPHLHFALSVFAVYVDPEPFYESPPPL
jgi:murein DD-endopeptidase MepM/ murein hydrolase activator NlpD